MKCSEPCLGTHTVLRNPRFQSIMASGGGGPPPPTPTSPLPPPHMPTVDKLALPPDQRKGMSAAGSGGMSRSISDTTLRRAALHLNLSQSVLPSFTSLQQFKVEKMEKQRRKNSMIHNIVDYEIVWPAWSVHLVCKSLILANPSLCPLRPMSTINEILNRRRGDEK